MKTCPYCAEEIKDAAIRCRWCLTWLVDDVPAGADGPKPAAAERGRGASKDAPKPMPQATMVQPVRAEPKAPEPLPTSAPERKTPEPAPTPAAAPAQAAPAPQSGPAPQPAPAPAETKVEFTHTGSRYLLGYGADYFGIWDRNAPQQPIERFPRNDAGWAAAWQRYSAIESNWMDLRTGQKSG